MRGPDAVIVALPIRLHTDHITEFTDKTSTHKFITVLYNESRLLQRSQNTIEIYVTV